jgi:ankyrin repeat protein
VKLSPFIERNRQAGDSALIVALKRRDLNMLTRLAADGTLREATDANGYTPLMIAAHFNFQPEVTILLKHNTCIEAKTIKSWTALSMAISAKHIEMMKILLESGGADATVLDDRQATLMHKACETGSIHVVRALIDALSRVQLSFSITSRDKHGHTALVVAIKDDNAAVVRVLLECGSPPNSAISLVGGLIHWRYFRTVIFPILLKHGLQLDTFDDLGKTPLHIVARFKHGDSYMKELTLHGADPCAVTRDERETVLHIAAFKPNDEFLRNILPTQVKVVINAKNINDHTALYIAASKANYEACDLLLQHGADVDVRCQASEAHPKGYTALHSASHYGHAKIVNLLLAAGADKENLSDGGATPLYIAASRGHLNVVRALTQAGANIRFKRTSKDSVVTIARENGHMKTAIYLASAVQFRSPRV